MTTILILHETPVDKIFTANSIVGKEAKLRQAVKSVDQILIISRPKNNFAVTADAAASPLSKIKVILTPPWPYYLSGIILFLYGFIICLKNRPNWLEAESPLFSGPPAILLGTIFRLKTIIEIRSDFADVSRFRFRYLPLSIKQFLIHRLQGWTLSQASAIITNSRYYARTFVPPHKPFAIINPGLNSLPTPKTNYQINPPKFQLGYLGRLVPEKGISLLIQAVNELPKNPHLPPFRLTIAGVGPEETILEHEVALLHLNSVISFAGFQPSQKFLSNLHLLINPCLVNAPLEMVNAEAAQLGIPVICFGSKDVPETVRDGQTGLKIKDVSSQALAAAMTQFLTNGLLRTQLHTHGPDFARKNFSFSAQVNRLSALYRDLKLI